MSKWWESERSKQAAAIRFTRKRLRAAYRESLRRSEERLRRKMEDEALQWRLRLAEAESLAREAALEMSRPHLFVRDWELEKLLRCELSLHRDLFLLCKNPSEMIGAICRHLGDAVAEKAFELARSETRTFGHEPRRAATFSGLVSDSTVAPKQ